MKLLWRRADININGAADINGDAINYINYVLCRENLYVSEDVKKCPKARYSDMSIYERVYI